MRRLQRAFFLCSFLAVSCGRPFQPIGREIAEPDVAEAWTSSGGDLISVDDNPWFLANKPDVTYCIHLDEAGMGITLEQAGKSVRDAVKFWHDQFRFSRPDPNLLSEMYLNEPMK